MFHARLEGHCIQGLYPHSTASLLQVVAQSYSWFCTIAAVTSLECTKMTWRDPSESLVRHDNTMAPHLLTKGTGHILYDGTMQ